LKVRLPTIDASISAFWLAEIPMFDGYCDSSPHFGLVKVVKSLFLVNTWGRIYGSVASRVIGISRRREELENVCFFC
jgi:hypothetical protein